MNENIDLSVKYPASYMSHPVWYPFSPIDGMTHYYEFSIHKAHVDGVEKGQALEEQDWYLKIF